MNPDAITLRYSLNSSKDRFESSDGFPDLPYDGPAPRMIVPIAIATEFYRSFSGPTTPEKPKLEPCSCGVPLDAMNTSVGADAYAPRRYD